MRIALVFVAPAVLAGTAAAGQQATQESEPPVHVADAAQPALRPVQGPPSGPSFNPQLPGDTPAALAQADPAAPVTSFAAAIARAYWTSPTLLAERARVRSVDFRLPQARGQFGPQLQYALSYDFQRDTAKQVTGEATSRSGWTPTARAILAQPLFTFGRLAANEDAARGAVAFARASLRVSEQQALFNAIGAYSQLIRDRIGVTIAADNERLLAKEGRDTDARLAVREATITDAEQVRSRLELARSQLIVAEGSAASSEAAFVRYVGGPAGDLSPPNPLLIPAQTLADAYAYAAANNPLLASANAREQISRAELRSARAELLPRIDLNGQALRGAVDPYSPSLPLTELRGGITLSGIVDSGVRRARVGEASAANDADWRLIDAQLRDNRAETADAWDEWQAQTAAASRLTLAVDAAQRALSGAIEQEAAGLRTTLEVLELTRDLLQVRGSLNNAAAAGFIAQARLLAAMGALHLEYLMPDSARYDPEAHFSRVSRQADVPLITPLLSALDRLGSGSGTHDRVARDPAASIAAAPPRLGPSGVERP